MAENLKDETRQLRKLNFDLENYFSNTIIPQLFVDADLILRIFTPHAMKQFSLTYEHVGKNISDIKDNLRYLHVVEDIQDVIDNPKKVLEKEVQTTDGRWFQMNIVPYIEHETGQINGVIITFVDITKRLNALKDLEILNSKHETLVFALSHDIRQPISAITLLADGLAQAHHKNDSKQFDKWIKVLKESSKSMASLVDDFTSENENISSEDPEGQKVNIQEICRDVLIALKTEIRLNKIEVITNFNAEQIIFPKNNLRSVIYNLVHNAIKYRNPGKTSKIEIYTEKVKGFVILCVKDNGPGIAEEDQKQIFDKSSRIRQDVKGTGMGLYIAKKMIEANDGRIKLKSKPGVGSLFQVYFRSEIKN